MKLYRFIMPLRLRLSKSSKGKLYTINYNTIKPLHHSTYNNLKKKYTELLTPTLNSIKMGKKVEVTYTIFFGSKRLGDVSNFCFMHDKFFCDALVVNGCLTDDNYNVVPTVKYTFGGIDKTNPRMEITVREL